MKKILAFGASSSRQSINKKFADFAAHQIADVEITLVDLNDFEAPIFSIDKEKENGFPEVIIAFKELVKTHDGIIISFAEHNGAYAAAFKNIFDWISRLEGKSWDEKPMFLMATSPGGRGGKTVLEIAANRFPRNGGNVVALFSLPSFNGNFSKEDGITDEDLSKVFQDQLTVFKAAL